MPQFNQQNPFSALANAIGRITRAANSGNAGQAAARGARGLNTSPNRQVQQGGGSRGGGARFAAPSQSQGATFPVGQQGRMFGAEQMQVGYGSGGGNVDQVAAERALFDNPLANRQMQMDAAEQQENGSEEPSYEYKRTTISHPASGRPKTPDSWGRVYYNEDGDKFAESTDADTGTTTTRYRPSPDGSNMKFAAAPILSSDLMDSAISNISSGSEGNQTSNAKESSQIKNAKKEVLSRNPGVIPDVSVLGIPFDNPNVRRFNQATEGLAGVARGATPREVALSAGTPLPTLAGALNVLDLLMGVEQAHADELGGGETNGGETKSSSSGEKNEGSPIPNAQIPSNPYAPSRQKPVVNADLPKADTSALAQADARIRRMNIDAMSEETQPMVDRAMAPASDWERQRLATSLRVGNDVPGMADVSGRGIVVGDKPPINSDVDKATQYQLANPQNEFESRVLQDQLDNAVNDRALATDIYGREIPQGSSEEIQKVLNAEKYNPGSTSTEEKRQALDDMSAENYQNAGTGEGGTAVNPETGQPAYDEGLSETEAFNQYLAANPDLAYSDFLDFQLNGTADDWYNWVMSDIAYPNYAESVNRDWDQNEFASEWFDPNKAENSISNLMVNYATDPFYEAMGYDPVLYRLFSDYRINNGLENYALSLGLDPTNAEDGAEQLQKLIDAETAMAAYGALQDGDMHGWTEEDLDSIWNPLGYDIGTGDGYTYSTGDDYLNANPNLVSFGNWWEYDPASEYLTNLMTSDAANGTDNFNALSGQSTFNPQADSKNPNLYKGYGLPTAYTGQLLNSLGYGYKEI